MRQPALRDAARSAQSRYSERAAPRPGGAPPGPIQTGANTSPTIVRFSPELETLGAVPGPEMKFTASRRESPQAAQFRVAVDENGEVRYCFLENSSGDGALDEQARKYLALSDSPPSAIRHPKLENGFVWGTATIEWGNDVVVPSAAATESVAP